MLTATWPSPSGVDEYALSFDQGRKHRVLVIPALFDEGNKLRHFTVATMRALHAAGIDCMLPDLPGANESPSRLAEQSLDSWRAAMQSAAAHFAATHVLTVRGGAILAPEGLPSIRYAAATGSSQLRGMLRAQVLASREAGVPTSRNELEEQGRRDGVVLAGYALGPTLFADLCDSPLPPQCLTDIEQADLGGPGLWLRAEPGHDAAQAKTLARLVAERVA